MLSEKNKIMDEKAFSRTLVRMAHEIIEKNENEDEICLVGIIRRGLPIAEKIADNIRKFSDIKVNIGSLDITLYRDDLSTIDDLPVVNNSKIGFDIEGKTVILVDDVIYTGRTVRSAMDALVHFGRPSRIQLAVLVDRGHRELPICGNYVGKNIPTSKQEVVKVKVPEFDGETSVTIYCSDKS